ncbi:MAG: hypothetical protein FJX54_17100 [Alphaproteobacteria bacterium]|nr:hypothetical protein [Alphaproteobacteria bacterium]
MIVREIEFGEAGASPGLVIRALEILGLEGRAGLKGPLKVNGKVTGCLVRFHDEADAEKFVTAWKGFLELKRKGGPATGFAPAYSFAPILPKIELPKPE